MKKEWKESQNYFGTVLAQTLRRSHEHAFGYV